MAETKYLSQDGLQHYDAKLKEALVKREHKTGSEEEWKVLSDNNFTDEMKAQLEAEEGFEGTYESLTGKPTIDGHEVGATNTAESLGLAKAEDIPGVATTGEAGLVKPDGTTITVEVDGTIKVAELDQYAKKADLPTAATSEKAGIVKPDGTSVKVTEDGEISVELPDVSDMLTKTDAAKEYLKQTTATDTYATKTAIEDMATKTELGEYAKKSDVTGAFVYKGSVAFDGLPTPSAENVGHVYNVNELFTTDDKFETPSQSYPAGTNVVVADMGGESYKFDVFTGFIDTSGFVGKSELVAITNGEIDALFSA